MAPGMEAAQMIRKLGQREGLPNLLQMARKMESVVRTSVISGADPFAKVKGMIKSMHEKLKRQMEDEATHKAYCDKEMGETKKHKDSKETEKEKISTVIDTQTSKSMNIKRLVATLQKELVANQEVQQEMNKMRLAEKAIFEKTKPEIELGIEGVKKALQVLREYYSSDDDQGGEGGKS